MAYLLNLKIQLITSQTSFLGFCELQPTRHFVFFPDLTTLITSRQFNSKLGKNLQQTIQNIRFLSNVYVATIPNFSSAEKTFRQVFTECPLIKAQNKRLLHLPLDNYFVIDIPELDEKFRLNVLIDDLKAKKEYLSSLGSTLKF